jgi:thioredoxin-dependent peroxiredoxin
MIQNNSSLLRLRLFALLSLAFTNAFSQSKKEIMKISPPQEAPHFKTKDINGKTVNLADYRGKKIMLTFYRNVGCPVCNFRFHELQEQADSFKVKDLILLAVYESTTENMKQYLEGEDPYALMISNPEQDLYKLYNIDRSMGKMMKGMFHGAMSKMNKGKKLFKRKIKQDGNSNRISADFLIDKNGKVQTAYYGKFIGDHLPMYEIKNFINN